MHHIYLCFHQLKIDGIVNRDVKICIREGTDVRCLNKSTNEFEILPFNKMLNQQFDLSRHAAPTAFFITLKVAIEF